MINRRIISAAVALIGSAVGLVLSAAHTKEDLIEIRRQRWNAIRKYAENRKNRIGEGLEEYRSTPGAVLLDVREKEDYDQGHIPGAAHAELRALKNLPFDPETPIFIYCYRGYRSAMAAETLKEAGFEKVKEIGGMEWYKGELETE